MNSARGFPSVRFWAIALVLGLLPVIGLAATYTNASTTYSWIDSSGHTKVGHNTVPYKFNGGGGCATTPPVLDDTLSDSIPLGFNFVFGTTTYNALRIMTNGRLQFGNTTCGAGTAGIGPPQSYPFTYPNASMNSTMKVFGVDLDPTNLVDKPNYPSSAAKTPCTSAATCYVSYATLGSAPNRKFVVTWKNVPEWVTASNTSGSFDVQVVLNEDGTFIFQYGTVVHGGTGTAQIGWQLTTTDFSVLTFGAAAEPPPGTAIIFYIPSANPLASYQFEDGAWSSGGAGQVTDANANLRPGKARGAAQETSAGKVCRGANIPANTAAGTVDAIETGVNFGSPSVNMLGQGTVMFWYKSNLPWNGASATAVQLLDATAVGGEWFFLTKTATGTLYFEVKDSAGTIRSVETAAQTIAAGTWVHVAVSWNFNANPLANSDRISVVINGATVTTSSFTTAGTVTPSVGLLHAGDNPSGLVDAKGSVNSANGTLDELLFYNSELNTGQILAASALTHACPSFVIDHFELRHPTWSGVACSPATLTLVACANAACTSLYTKGVIATLTASGATTVWDPAGGGATVVIGNTQSSATRDFYTDIGTATFGATSTGVPVLPTNVTKCDGVAGSCVWTSANAGLILTAPIIVGGQPTAVSVQAVESIAGVPVAACKAIPGISSAGLKVWATPGAPAAFPAKSTSAGVTVGGPPQGAAAVGGSYVDLPAAKPGSDNLTGFAFDGTASTSLWIKHMDVGSWTLLAQLDIAASASSPALSLSGSTAAKTIPAGFGVQVPAGWIAPAATQTACASAGPACDTAAGADPKVAAAGDTFGSQVTAALWTGVGDADFSDNPVAPSYSGSVTLAPGLAAPAAGSVGTLAVLGASLTGGTSGAITQAFTQSGALRITASGTYLGQSISSTTPVLGRIVPHHFKTTLTAAGCGSFTYSGQPMTTVTVEAMDGGGTAAQTKNYQGAFARSVTLTDGSGIGVGVLTANVIASAGFGIAGQEGKASAAPVYTFSSAKTNPAILLLRASDGEVTSSGVVGAEALSAIRSGRLSLVNAYGTEFLPLRVPVTAQYWSSGWQLNRADNCTALTVPTVGNGGLVFYGSTPRNQLTSAKTTASMGGTPAGTLVSGDALLSFSAPGVGGYGYLDVIGSKLGSPAWLSPTGDARVCFGSCGPRSPLIYHRESY